MTLQMTFGDAMNQLESREQELLRQLEGVRAQRDSLTRLAEFLRENPPARRNRPPSGSRLDQEVLDYINDPRGRDPQILRASLDTRLGEHLNRAYRRVDGGAREPAEEHPEQSADLDQFTGRRGEDPGPRLDLLIGELGTGPVMEALGADEAILGGLRCGALRWTTEQRRGLSRLESIIEEAKTW